MELYAVEFANFVISNRNISFFIDEQNNSGHGTRSNNNHAESDGVTGFGFILHSTVTEKEKSQQEIL